MLLQIVSYNGTAINDGTNYEAFFPHGQPSMPAASPQYAPRSRTFPKLASKDIQAAIMVFHVITKGTIHSQFETLKALFPVDDYTPRSLVVQDAADSNRQWYVKGYACVPVTPVDDGAGDYVIQLALDEPLWRTVTADSDNWSVTATGQTKALTIRGNQTARPIITITPTTVKPSGNGYVYRRWWPWYNPLTVGNWNPLELTNGGINTATLVADSTKTNLINQGGGINNSVTTIPIDTPTGGGLPAIGMGYLDTEQISWTGNSGVSLTGVTRGIGGTAAASHADNAVINNSKMLANGQDLLVVMDGALADRWLAGMNSATTKIWINARFSPKIEMTLSGAIAGSGTPGTISVKQTAANLAGLKALPAKFLVTIGVEVFQGYNADPSNYRFSLLARAAKGTSMAAHADGDTIRWIEHDIYIVYGNQSGVAVPVDNTKQPIIDLSASTNASWVYTSFASGDGLRSGGWISALAARTGSQSNIYTGSHGAAADPATEMGMAMKAWQANNTWKPENATMIWELYHVAGFTTITVTGAKRRIGTDWPAITALWCAVDGKTWATVFNEATPGAAGSWGALASHSAVALGGTFQYLAFVMTGTLAGTVSNEADMEIQDGTFVLASANVPQASFATVEEATYYLNATITVQETGDAITLVIPMLLNQTLTVDCDAQAITLDGLAVSPISWNSVRGSWLDVPAGTATLRYDEAGAAGVTVVTSWENRNTL